MIDDDSDPDALGSWNPPYADNVAEDRAMREWLNYHPDQEPPWVLDGMAAPAARRRVDVAPVVERSVDPEAAAPDTTAAEPGPVSLPPSPLPIGTRVLFLTSAVSGYGRGIHARATIVGWDGVAFEILFGRREEPIRIDPSRVSALDYWENPVHPERVTWMRGDDLPRLPLPPPGSPAPPSTAPTRETMREPATSSVVVLGSTFPGMFPCGPA